MKRLESNDHAILIEEGSRTLVEILDNLSNNEVEKYRVKVLQLLCNRYDGGNELKGGETLTIDQKTNSFKVWDLERVE